MHSHSYPGRQSLVRLLPLCGSAVLALVLGLGVASPALAAPDVDVVAHRGSSGAAPENTLAAVRLAITQKSDVVENDIHRTRDGELVIVHDTTLARTTDVETKFPDRAPWNVGDFTLAEIKTLDAGSWFGPEFVGERVPTLAQWVRAVGSRAGMLLEVKAPELYPGIEVDVDKELRLLSAFNAAVRGGRVVVPSFAPAWLRTYAALAPDVPVGLLFAGGPPREAPLADAAGWADQANPALGDVPDAALVDLIHSYGLETHVWTVNDATNMRKAIRFGVDGVITNFPQLLRDVLRNG
jgi:glycerophosphoryl diester phosphodiesterase